MSAFFGVYTYIDVIGTNGHKFNNSYYFEGRDVSGAFYLAISEKYDASPDNESSDTWVKENEKINNSKKYVNKILEAKSIKEIEDVVLNIYGTEDPVTDYMREKVETQNTFIPTDISFSDIKRIKISEKYCDFIDGGEILTTISFKNNDGRLDILEGLREVESFDDIEENSEKEIIDESPASTIDRILLQKYIDKFKNLDEDVKRFIYYRHKRGETTVYYEGQGPLIKEQEYREMLINPIPIIESILLWYDLREDLVDRYFDDEVRKYTKISGLYECYDYPENLDLSNKKINTSYLIVDEYGKQLKKKGCKLQSSQPNSATEIYIAISKYQESEELKKAIRLKEKTGKILIIDFNYFEYLLK